MFAKALVRGWLVFLRWDLACSWYVLLDGLRRLEYGVCKRWMFRYTRKL